MPSPTPLTHARPKATRIQSALAGARKVSPPACFTLVISGSSGSGWGVGVSASLEVALASLVLSSPSLQATCGRARVSAKPTRGSRLFKLLLWPGDPHRGPTVGGGPRDNEPGTPYGH